MSNIQYPKTPTHLNKFVFIYLILTNNIITAAFLHIGDSYLHGAS